MFRTMLASQLVLAVCCFCSAQAAASEPSFEEAFAAAEKFVHNYKLSQSFQQRKDRLNEIITRYRNEPGVERAKLLLAHVLVSEDSNESYAAAAKVLDELNSPGTQTDFQMTVAEMYLEFHLERTRWPERRHLQRLKRARETAVAFVEAAAAKGMLAAELRGRRWTAMAEAQLGNGREAVRQLFAATDGITAWHASGRLDVEKSKSVLSVAEISCAIGNVGCELGALPRSFENDPPNMRKVILLVEQELDARPLSTYDRWHIVAREQIEERKVELRELLRGYEPPLVQ